MSETGINTDKLSDLMDEEGDDAPYGENTVECPFCPEDPSESNEDCLCGGSGTMEPMEITLHSHLLDLRSSLEQQLEESRSALDQAMSTLDEFKKAFRDLQKDNTCLIAALYSMTTGKTEEATDILRKSLAARGLI